MARLRDSWPLTLTASTQKGNPSCPSHLLGNRMRQRERKFAMQFSASLLKRPHVKLGNSERVTEAIVASYAAARCGQSFVENAKVFAADWACPLACTAAKVFLGGT